MAGAEHTVTPDEASIQEFTTRAIAEIFPSPDALAEELRSGRQLTAYMGIDPTGPDMHVGHASQLLKLARLQEMGHHVILLIGDFTAMIGDPTDRSATRVRLSRDQVLENAHGYQQQASKVLDFEHPTNPAELRFNSEWLNPLGAEGMLDLAGRATVQQMLERRSFRDRIDQQKPLSVVEFLYPLLQGYDSVAMGVDIEIGGSDQIFNMMFGGELVRRELGKQKYVVAGQLLADPGGKKIGKTEGNMITLNDPPLVMQERVMRWGDRIVPHALELCTTMPMAEVRGVAARMDSGELSGLAAKRLLAREIVTSFHDEAAAETAEAQQRRLASGDIAGDPDLLALLTGARIVPGQAVTDILTGSGLAASRSEAARLLRQGGVNVNGQQVTGEWTAPDDSDGPLILRVGKRSLANHRRLEFAPQG